MKRRATPNESARAAGLLYVSGTAGWISRRRAGKTFTYLSAEGTPVTDEADLERFRRLGIPPAWTVVRICPDAQGHIQAVGHDARGRKQYRYHPRWREVRDEAKFDRMQAFGRALPAIRARVERDLRRQGLPRDKVLAAVVRLLERTQIRVGNEEYARTNQSFGLTTMRRHHVDVGSERLRFSFRGKSGKMHAIGLKDGRLARLVRRCQELPGQELFQYLDARGTRRAVTSDDVNTYLRDASGRPFTAKDYRTWAATVRAAWELVSQEPCRSPREGRRTVNKAIANVARRLGNTPAICRASYIHPGVLAAYLDGSLHASMKRRRPAAEGLAPVEASLLAFLRHAGRAATAEDRLERSLRASVAARTAHA